MYSINIMGTIDFDEKRLQHMLDKRGFTPSQLATYTGISQGMVSLLLSGKRGPSAAVLAKIARQLGCSMEYLVGLTDEESPKAMELDDELFRLLQIARELRPHRLDDLIATAEMYKQRKENSALLLQSAIVDAVEAESSEEHRDRMLAALETLWPLVSPGESFDGGDSVFRRLTGDEGK